MTNPQEDNSARDTSVERKENAQACWVLGCMLGLTLINALIVTIPFAIALRWWAILVFFVALIGFMIVNVGQTAVEAIIRQLILLVLMIILMPTFMKARQRAQHVRELHQQKTQQQGTPTR